MSFCFPHVKAAVWDPQLERDLVPAGNSLFTHSVLPVHPHSDQYNALPQITCQFHAGPSRRSIKACVRCTSESEWPSVLPQRCTYSGLPCPLLSTTITLVVQEAGKCILCLALFRNNENNMNAQWLLRRLRNMQHIHCNPMSGLRKHLKNHDAFCATSVTVSFLTVNYSPYFPIEEYLFSTPNPFTKNKAYPVLAFSTPLHRADAALKVQAAYVHLQTARDGLHVNYTLNKSHVCQNCMFPTSDERTAVT